MAHGPARRFFWRDRPREAPEGATALEALARDGLPALARSYRYHRPRGPFCGVGYCAGCLVRVNGVPNQRACRHVLEEGDRIRNTNGWPSARFDLFGVIDRVFPNGIDTLRGFRRPMFLTPLYQRVIRRLAGYGPVPAAPPTALSPPAPLSVDRDVVVIGAGTSGRAAAARLVARGLRPLLVDRALRVPEAPGSELLPRTNVTFLPPPTPGADPRFQLIGFQEPDRGVVVRARTVVVATGGYDAGLLFADNDRPGIFSAEGALAISASDRSRVFRRAVLVGGGERAGQILDRLSERVTAVVTPGEIRPEVVRAASDADIPLYPRTLLLGTRGTGRVRGVHLRARGSGPSFRLGCDAVILAHRRLPNPQLLFQAGAQMSWRSGTGAYYPVLDSTLSTTVARLYAVGTVAGVLSESAAVSGVRAADALAGDPSPASELPRVAESGPHELDGYYRELKPWLRSGRPVVCPCEDVLLRDVEAAHERGYLGVEVVKRYTGLGTGLCQGRYCLPDALLLLAILEGRPPSEVGFMTQRPPVVATPLEALAAIEELVAAEASP
ncbi:MAG TPA: 2Fe-2S iron-sulfur cluster-binding protein [Thermoplasmata archaeon]|nr:2Fe-2S iron-sulfur cluster-binding protein [Thermoplasmata archaeon]